jgi:hypothetical protein
VTDQAEAILAALADKSELTVLIGTFVSANSSGTLLTVDVGGGRIPVLPLGSYLPEVNEPVWVAFIDGQPYLAGPTKAKPGQGTVTSVASGFVTLSTDFGPVTVPYDSRLAPSAGQLMKLSWQGGGFAIAIMSANPTPPTPPTGGGGGAIIHVDTFSALDAGSYQGGRWWQAEVWASDNNLGAWFYGSKIADTIPAAAIISRVEFFASMKQVQGFSPNFALHADRSKGGAPSLGATTALSVAAGGWMDLPAGFGNALKLGGGSFGVGVAHGGFNIFHSLAEDGQSGALRITSTY